MRILGIETSCDETAAAIVENGTKILTSTVASSSQLHQKTGGIIPEVAAREQIKYIVPIINETLQQRTKNNPSTSLRVKEQRTIKEPMSDIDAIAVTIGPGLIGSLLVGVETAKTIAYITKKPIVPVNHIFAHIYANWLRSPRRSSLQDKPSGHLPDGAKGRTVWCIPKRLLEGELGKKPEFPAVALVVSGGHTELFLIKSHGNLKWLGGTRDDAAGEAFDKTARLLGLGFPGGPAIAAEAAKFRIKPACRNLELRTKNNIKLPRPMIDEDNLDFSFSGLKTAVIKEINKLKTIKQWNNETIKYLAYEIQEAITDVLVEKTIKATRKYQAKSILLGGGVAANKRLKEKFKFLVLSSKSSVDLYIPPPHLCTDNAAYIASYAYFNYHPIPWKKIQAQPNLEIEV